MATKPQSKSSSDRRNWNSIYVGLVKMLQTQQTQLETLAQDKKILEDRLRMQHDRWLSDVDLLQHQISQVKGNLLDQEMAASLEAAKSELFVGLKHREAYLSKLKLGHAESELEDFRAILRLISQKSLNLKDAGKGSIKKYLTSTKNDEHHFENLQSEIKRLKREYDKIVLEKNSEVSALLSEKNFVWNQYKVLESECESKLKSQNMKVQQAEEKVHNLISTLEHFQLSNERKEEKNAKLISQLIGLRKESDKFKEECQRLSKELDMLRNSRTSLVTPVLSRCTTTRTIRSSIMKGNQINSKSGILALRQESSSVVASDSVGNSEKESRRSKKRPAKDISSVLDSPKLFTSSFKVPKLKNSPPTIISPTAGH